ncbi:hypothetical protein DOE78_23035 [Bacillus sp. Y1]|nr:cell wall-binding repeat-containing protein [Bacillus sp. Y1]AYA78041.1 hypothetical protein DOE78_23035 [Bacillus sp. Y1]
MFFKSFSRLILLFLFIIAVPSFANAEDALDIPTRIEGKDRFEVATNIAKKWTSSETVVIANYLAFADALTASPLAYKHNAPILLTHPGSLTAQTREEITRLGAKKIYIIGGEGSVSNQVQQELVNLGKEVVRISGKDRFEVSERVAMEVGINGSIVVANGLVFADALTIAPYASVNGSPILLTRNNELPPNIITLIQAHPIHNSVIVGGEASVAPSVAAQLPNPERIGGRDRYEVAANIAQRFGQNRSKVYIATGQTFADALAGSVLAAKENAVMLLANKDQITDYTSNIVKQKNVPITILGGTGSVKDNVVQSLSNIVPSQRPIIYLVPHQDDEILSFGVDIRNELSKGRDVHLVLLTAGEESGARDILNGALDFESSPPYLAGQRVYCQVHGRYHDPVKEGYMHGPLSPGEFANARTDEYVRASKALGVPPQNIHTDFISRGSYDGTSVKNILQKYLTTYPNAEVRTMSWFDYHSAHALLGRTIKGMQEDGLLARYQAKFLLSIYTDRFYNVKAPMETIRVDLINTNDKNYMVNAINEYKRFEPRNGIYGVGYHSVSSQFDSLAKNTYTKIHY